jgi:hypothetical protein
MGAGFTFENEMFYQIKSILKIAYKKTYFNNY